MAVSSGPSTSPSDKPSNKPSAATNSFSKQFPSNDSIGGSVNECWEQAISSSYFKCLFQATDLFQFGVAMCLGRTRVLCWCNCSNRVFYLSDNARFEWQSLCASRPTRTRVGSRRPPRRFDQGHLSCQKWCTPSTIIMGYDRWRRRERTGTGRFLAGKMDGSGYSVDRPRHQSTRPNQLGGHCRNSHSSQSFDIVDRWVVRTRCSGRRRYCFHTRTLGAAAAFFCHQEFPVLGSVFHLPFSCRCRSLVLYYPYGTGGGWQRRGVALLRRWQQWHYCCCCCCCCCCCFSCCIGSGLTQLPVRHRKTEQLLALLVFDAWWIVGRRLDGSTWTALGHVDLGLHLDGNRTAIGRQLGGNWMALVLMGR
jgi:hypothetical protein